MYFFTGRGDLEGVAQECDILGLELEQLSVQLKTTTAAARDKMV